MPSPCARVHPRRPGPAGGGHGTQTVHTVYSWTSMVEQPPQRALIFYSPGERGAPLLPAANAYLGGE